MQYEKTLIALAYLRYSQTHQRSPQNLAQIKDAVETARPKSYDDPNYSKCVSIRTIFNPANTKKSTMELSWNEAARFTFKNYLGEELAKVQESEGIEQVFDKNNINTLLNSISSLSVISPKVVEEILLTLGFGKKKQPELLAGDEKKPDSALLLLPPVNDKRFSLGVCKYQDVLLAAFFESIFKIYFPNLTIKQYDNWSDLEEALQRDEIEYCISDFGSVVCLNKVEPYYFFPQFYFKGLFILGEIIGKSFNLMSRVEIKDYLERAKILCEKGTDFEWFILELCQYYCCDLNIIKRNITYMDVNTAKKLYLDNNEGYTIYCTNPTHWIDISGKILRKEVAGIELIMGSGQKKSLIIHNNYNGQICKKSTYENDPTIIEGLKYVWFNLIIPQLLLEIENGQDASKNCVEHSFKLSGTLDALRNKLGKITNSRISDSDFVNKIYAANLFHKSYDKSKKSFLTHLENSDMLSNYKKIVELRIGGFDEIDQTIENIKNQISVS